MTTGEGARLAKTLELPLEAARRAVAETAESWQAEWRGGIDGGELVLPVVYGLRHGVERGRLRLVRESAGRTRVEWTLDESVIEVRRPAVAILVLAAVPLVGTVAWPFWPGLLPLVPFAAVMGLVAWWLVVSRLKSSGPEEFLAALAEGGAESPGGVVR